MRRSPEESQKSRFSSQTVWPSDLQFWRPVYLADPPTPFLLRRDNFSYRAVGRLLPGVSLEQAQARLSALAQLAAQEFPDIREGWGPDAAECRANS